MCIRDRVEVEGQLETRDLGLPGVVICRAGLLMLEWQSLEESDVVTVQRRWAIGPLR